MLIDSRVTGREGERNTDVRKRHCSPLAHTSEGDHTGNPVKGALTGTFWFPGPHLPGPASGS